MRPLLLALALTLLLPAAAARADELPLGPPGLTEARTTTVLAPGITHTRIVRGAPSPDEAWIVDAAFVADRAAADALVARLAAAGAPARVERIDDRPQDAPGAGPQGYLVRTGSFATQAAADAERARLTALGFTGLRTVFAAEDGRSTTGPWVVNVLEAAPWRVRAALATDVVPDRELPHRPGGTQWRARLDQRRLLRDRGRERHGRRPGRPLDPARRAAVRGGRRPHEPRARPVRRVGPGAPRRRLGPGGGRRAPRARRLEPGARPDPRLRRHRRPPDRRPEARLHLHGPGRADPLLARIRRGHPGGRGRRGGALAARSRDRGACRARRRDPARRRGAGRDRRRGGLAAAPRAPRPPARDAHRRAR